MGKRSFEEVYPVKDSYKRFNFRNNALGRAERAEGDSYRRFDYEEGRAERMKKGLPGFSLLDYAFKDAALTAAQASQSGRGRMNSGFYSWSPLGVARRPEGEPRWEASPEDASRVVAKAARYYGAVGAGFCELDRRWVYSHTRYGQEIVFEDVEEEAVIPESHRWVIAITVPMEVEEMMYAPTALNPTSNMGYSKMAVVAGSVVEFIRGLGWHAIPCGNDTAISVPIAIQAGLGHAGRQGRLITWDRGPMVRICKVLTDLPLAPSPMASEGIIEYCEVCKKCARRCPINAISEGPRAYEGYSEANNPGVLKWYCDEDACLRYFREVGTGCSICFRVCSFTKPDTALHRLVKWFIRNVPQLNRLWVWADDLMGYGKMSDPSRYWEEN